jgi:dTDP-glucose pyrophosphorylase
VSTTTAVVLAAGKGTRMQRADASARLTGEQARAAAAGAKAMIPIGRPFLDYVLSALADGGIDDVCIVVSSRDTALRARYTEPGVLSRLRVRFALQPEPRGTADAVRCARECLDTEQFLVLNADNVYSARTVRAMSAIDGCGLAGYRAGPLVRLSNIPRERLRAFALLDVDPSGRLRSITEKPASAPDSAFGDDALVSMNLWSFTSAMFDACEGVRPSVRGELELADAVRLAMDDLGIPFHVTVVDDGVLDLSSRSDIAAVTQRLRDVAVNL